MGQEISASRFTPDDFERFRQRLQDETQLACRSFVQGSFASSGRVAGFELEACLVDRHLFPAPCNVRFLERLSDPLVVPELSRFNVEINGTPQPVEGTAFSRMEAELTHTWARCVAMAHEEEATIVAVGTLPTLRESDLDLATMTPSNRYVALNHEVLRARGGRPIALNIHGMSGSLDHLVTTHADVMLEAAATSFQLHLQVGATQIARHLNASMVLSAPLVALAANSPFLFGHKLWHETRIPLFEQAVECGDAAHPRLRRVSFGQAYVGDDPTELFVDNLNRFPVLLPMLSDTPAHAYAHLRLQNGTIWRWNRLLVGVGEAGDPHLRIEQRVMPAGPSVIDMMANAALYYGAVHMLASQASPPEASLPFEQARENFYRAARDGLDASITWLDGRTVPVADALEALLPLAREGLQRQDIASDDIDRYMDVLAVRLRTRRNGAAWQIAHHARHRDLFRLTADYLEHQRSGMPVHAWPL